ncbi:ATP-binding protein [Embleya sp. NPDC050154]|uniref:ATP-binding protein n=2 Tax=unclassified Embleya TaxID=2699296 RepID=UPI0037AC675E
MADMRAVGWARSFPVSGGIEAGRRWTRDHLESLAWTKDAPETVDDVLLTVSELITNAHVHAHSTAHLVLAWDNRCLNVYVSDTGPGLPVVRGEGDTPATSGRGLAIVDAVADEWETHPVPHGKAVIACFYPPGHDPHAAG